MKGLLFYLALALLVIWAYKAGKLYAAFEWVAERVRGVALAAFAWIMDKIGLD